ncbi:PAS domain-containing protein [Azospirillum sp.]|uniref:PAS domain-containing protein n=1 Tax=Azospirillum sp. TaxID=34012 RepID=UPI002D3B2C1B|nr:PAS domain-containing protein [Azospirillum sp.]HYD67754.1 PAS domain-containing protein [Azospirillum sp.]
MGGTWRTVIVGLAVAAMALAWVGVDAVQRASPGVGPGVGEDRDAAYAVIGALGLGVLALWVVFTRLSRHFRDIGQLDGDLGALRGRGELPAGWQGRSDELGRLAAAVGDLLRRDRRAGGRGEDKLAAVVAALEEPVLLLTDTGRIAALNGPASRMLGTVVAPGMDVYDLLDRPELFRAIERARDAGQPVSAVLRRNDGREFPARVADLGLQAGVAIVVPLRASDVRALLPPETGVRRAARAPHLGDGEPLGAVPLVALSVATDTAGRVTGVGTVRLSGGRVFRTVSLDLTLDPGEGVPPPGARPFADAWPVIAEALRNVAVAGLDAEAALAALAGEVERAGLPPFDPPPALDLGRIAAALDPALAGLDPARLAAALGVVHEDGPAGAPLALLTAEIAAALLLRLDAQGVRTLGEARALAPSPSPPPAEEGSPREFSPDL